MVRIAAMMALLWGPCVAIGAGNHTEPGSESLIGIDHIPTVVEDLDESSARYRELGFVLKPGRAHDNGLLNRHVKFKDGSGIELLSVPAAPKDELTRTYSALLRKGEGPAYLSFHARDSDARAAALNAADVGFSVTSGMTTLDDPRLGFLFFVEDNRSPTDRPEHFAHPNGAGAMSEVWLAVDEQTLVSLRTLFLALGAVETKKVVQAPDTTEAVVFHVQNGRVIVVQKRHQLINGREVIGATFRVSVQSDADTDAVIGGREGAGADSTPVNNLWLRFVR